MSSTRDIDLAHYAPAYPVAPLRGCGARDFHDLSDEFVAERAAKAVIAPENLAVSVANSCEKDSYSRPSRTKPGQGFFFSNEFSICGDE